MCCNESLGSWATELSIGIHQCTKNKSHKKEVPMSSLVFFGHVSGNTKQARQTNKQAEEPPTRAHHRPPNSTSRSIFEQLRHHPGWPLDTNHAHRFPIFFWFPYVPEWTVQGSLGLFVCANEKNTKLRFLPHLFHIVPSNLRIPLLVVMLFTRLCKRNVYADDECSWE